MVLQCRGETVHSLSLFQGCKVEGRSYSAGVHTVVGSGMDGLVGRTMEPVPGGMSCSVFRL